MPKVTISQTSIKKNIKIQKTCICFDYFFDLVLYHSTNRMAQHSVSKKKGTSPQIKRTRQSTTTAAPTTQFSAFPVPLPPIQ